MTKLSDKLSLSSNLLCSTIPTQVMALSSRMVEWSVTIGNSLGSECKTDPINTGSDGHGSGGSIDPRTTAAVAVSMVVLAAAALSFFLLRPWCNCLNSALDGSHTTNDWESGDSMEGDEYGEEYIELTAYQEDDERKGR